MATLLGSSPGSPGAEGSETTLGTEEGRGRGEAWGLRSPSSRGRSGEGPPACLGMGFKAKPYSPLRIILTGKMVPVSALVTVKQSARSNNFSILPEMMEMTHFFVPVCPALVHISFVTF